MKKTTKAPSWLDKEGKEFWKRHSQHCEDNGSLTPATSDTFSLLCRLWSIIAGTDPHADSKASMKFVGMLKQYLATAKFFGLLDARPPAKKTKGLGDKLKEIMNAKEA